MLLCIILFLFIQIKCLRTNCDFQTPPDQEAPAEITQTHNKILDNTTQQAQMHMASLGVYGVHVIENVCIKCRSGACVYVCICVFHWRY